MHLVDGFSYWLLMVVMTLSCVHMSCCSEMDMTQDEASYVKNYGRLEPVLTVARSDNRRHAPWRIVEQADETSASGEAMIMDKRTRNSMEEMEEGKLLPLILSAAAAGPKSRKYNQAILTQLMRQAAARRQSMKRSPNCMRKCIAQGLLHPAQCHSLC